MNVDEIKRHKNAKKMDENYPRLPLFILAPEKRRKRDDLDEGYKEACLRGFYNRLDNYQRKNIENHE